jgi:hypothetical protein
MIVPFLARVADDLIATADSSLDEPNDDHQDQSRNNRCQQDLGSINLVATSLEHEGRLERIVDQPKQNSEDNKPQNQSTEPAPAIPSRLSSTRVVTGLRTRRLGLLTGRLGLLTGRLRLLAGRLRLLTRRLGLLTGRLGLSTRSLGLLTGSRTEGGNSNRLHRILRRGLNSTNVLGSERRKRLNLHFNNKRKNSHTKT